MRKSSQVDSIGTTKGDSDEYIVLWYLFVNEN